jgi:hypothetical protein
MQIRPVQKLAANLLAAAFAAALRADAPAAPDNPFESAAVTTPASRIDQLVLGRLRHLGVTPAALCSDAVFVRRVYLDAIGTLPTAQATAAFLEDRNPEKRRALIDRLLAREEFADYWAMNCSRQAAATSAYRRSISTGRCRAGSRRRWHRRWR